jgi:hypothetical protein
MTDALDAAIATITSEQTYELNACLHELVQELLPRLPTDFRKQQKKRLDEIRKVSRLGDGQSELRRKALALDTLTRIVLSSSGRCHDDPIAPIFMRGMEALSQLGLVTRREVDMESEEGETLRQQYALQTATPPSDVLN